MARKVQNERLETIYDSIEDNPGERPGFFARVLNMPRSSVTRSLPTMEEEGYLLSEDDNGGLWPFRRKK
ncbi:MAG: hypothetical protein H6657_20870 [Ardenticatenaceae bacterium]|jgi:Mn-dependent DtxR family transcriptional regulator|nr:hypothetical protein [Ardenticatenaceae bacterium]